MGNLFELPCSLKVLGFIYENKGTNVNTVSRKLNITYSHVSKLHAALIQRKWIDYNRTGRDLLLVPTEKGSKIAEAYLYLVQTMEDRKDA